MRSSVVPARIPASEASYLDDVGRVLRAWRRAPALPVLAVLVALVQLAGGSANPALSGLAGLTALLLIGWTGAERVWLLRLWTGRELSVLDAWRVNLRCFGRFLVLGLVVVPAYLLLLLPAAVPAFSQLEVAADGAVTFDADLPLWTYVYAALVTVLGYALLTFVTPAIVYSSRRVRDAVPIGLRLLRVSWPRTAAYVLVPALWATAGVPTFLLPPGDPRAVAAAVVSAVVLAVARGAAAAYYVRSVPGAGPDGDLRLAPSPGYYPAPRDA